MLEPGSIEFTLLTFVLEFVGVSLAFVEVRMPATAAKLARFLGFLASPIEELRNQSSQGISDSSLIARSLGRLINTVLSIGTIPVFVIFVVSVVRMLVSEAFSLGWFIPLLVGFLITLVIVSLLLVLLCIALYFAVTTGSDFANRFVAGRAVGTLGILIAVLGLSLELVQLVAVLLS